MTNNCSKADYFKHTNRITEGELWDIMETGRDNVNNNEVLGGFMDRDLAGYSSHALADAMNK